MSFEQGESKRLGWIEQVERIYEVLGKTASICHNIVGIPISDDKKCPKKEPSTPAERLDYGLENLQNRAGIVLSQLEDIADKF